MRIKKKFLFCIVNLFLLPLVFLIPEPLIRYLVSLIVVLVTIFITFSPNISVKTFQSKTKNVINNFRQQTTSTKKEKLFNNRLKFVLQLCETIVLMLLIIMSGSNTFSFENESKTIITFRILWWVSTIYLTVCMTKLFSKRIFRPSTDVCVSELMKN